MFVVGQADLEMCLLLVRHIRYPGPGGGQAGRDAGHQGREEPCNRQAARHRCQGLEALGGG